MWKIAVGFAVFAGLAVLMLMQGGDVDLSGEKHGVEAAHEGSAPASAPAVPASATSQ